MKEKGYQEPPKEPTHPTPSITPEVIQMTFEALERKGMIYYSEGGIYIPTAKGWQLLMSTGIVREVIKAHGNPKITATNESTIKLTKGNDVDDATIGVRANKSSNDLSAEFKNAIRESKNVEIYIEIDDERIELSGYGSPSLKLNDTNYMTINKSDFVDDKTVVIMTDKSASDLDREFVEKLKNPNSRIKIVLEVK